MASDADRRGTASGPRFALDLAVGVVPWVGYGVAAAWDRPSTGAMIAAAVLVLVRLADWRRTKPVEVVILVWFAWVAVDTPPLPPAQVDAWRPASLPLLLAAVALGSVAAGRPFTLPYARAAVDPRWWDDVHFRRVNLILSSLWGVALLALASAALVLAPLAAPGRLAMALVSAATISAMLWLSAAFPYWYRRHCFLPLVRAGRAAYHPAPPRPRWLRRRGRRWT